MRALAPYSCQGQALGPRLRGDDAWSGVTYADFRNEVLSRVASVVIPLLLTAQPAAAGDFRSGLSAYNRGDYITAFRDWYPLAEHGDARAQAGLGFLFHKGSGA